MTLLNIIDSVLIFNVFYKSYFLRVNLDKNAMTFVLFTKKIDFYGDYDMAGRMMVIDLKGKGKATLNFSKSCRNIYSTYIRLFRKVVLKVSSKKLRYNDFTVPFSEFVFVA